MAKWGCEFLADMKARTGFQSGFSQSGYLVVAPPEREAFIRSTYATMRARGVEVELCDVDRILELEPRLADAGSGDRMLRADGRARAAALRRRRVRARGRARRRDDAPRHARHGAASRRRGLEPLARRRHARERGGRRRGLRPLGQQPHARPRGRRPARALARAGRALSPAARVRRPGADHLGSRPRSSGSSPKAAMVTT